MRRRLLLLLPVLAFRPARAAEREGAALVMLERHDCPWCRRWLREVGEEGWNASDLGRRAPLRRVDVARGLPPDLGFIAHWRFTPTFVLVREGREVGRIIGYQGALFFWQQAEALLARLPPDTPEEEERK
ncbi:transcriptional regulator [Crenalkalicoccus roseus]|uniref:transcriptional regulator n=1 Tax=Crenalkalicoccus roseus TaxID=1485588 RepID=UPI001959AB9E|nr:transcriptional regulator [Crenalkalicoccus roseus]